VDGLPRDVAGHVGGQKYCSAGHFVDMPWSTPSESCDLRSAADRSVTLAAILR
jgi:hypothetical protein